MPRYKICNDVTVITVIIVITIIILLLLLLSVYKSKCIVKKLGITSIDLFVRSFFHSGWFCGFSQEVFGVGQ